MTEIWKQSEGEYYISNTGKVKRDGYILKTRIDRYGYEIVTLTINGVYYTRKIHRLVAIAFIPNPENKPQVNHIGKDSAGNISKLMNNVDSLEWSTAQENINHSVENGLQLRGEGKTTAQLTDENVAEIKEMILAGYGNSFIGNIFGVTCGAIYPIRLDKGWTHIPWPEPYRLVTAWRGTKGGPSKLTAKSVSEIKDKLRQGISIAELQKQYEISGGALRCIRNGSTWKEIN